MHEAREAAVFLMDGLSTLNGCFRQRTGRNDWVRDFSAALTGSLSLMREGNHSAATPSVFCPCGRVRVRACARARVQKAATGVDASLTCARLAETTPNFQDCCFNSR